MKVKYAMNPMPMNDTKSGPAGFRCAKNAMTAMVTPIPSEMIRAYLEVRIAIKTWRHASGPAPPSQGNRGSRMLAAFCEAGMTIPPPCFIR